MRSPGGMIAAIPPPQAAPRRSVAPAPASGDRATMTEEEPSSDQEPSAHHSGGTG